MTAFAMFLLGFVAGMVALLAALAVFVWRLVSSVGTQMEGAKIMQAAAADRLSSALAAAGRVPAVEAEEESAN